MWKQKGNNKQPALITLNVALMRSFVTLCIVAIQLLLINFLFSAEIQDVHGALAKLRLQCMFDDLGRYGALLGHNIGCFLHEFVTFGILVLEVEEHFLLVALFPDVLYIWNRHRSAFWVAIYNMSGHVTHVK